MCRKMALPSNAGAARRTFKRFTSMSHGDQWSDDMFELTRGRLVRTIGPELFSNVILDGQSQRRKELVLRTGEGASSTRRERFLSWEAEESMRHPRPDSLRLRKKSIGRPRSPVQCEGKLANGLREPTRGCIIAVWIPKREILSD